MIPALIRPTESKMPLTERTVAASALVRPFDVINAGRNVKEDLNENVNIPMLEQNNKKGVYFKR